MIQTARTFGNGPTCTAQVINKLFLLTAAHCVADLFPSGPDQTQVTFTDGAGAPFVVANVPAQAVAIPNARQGDNDDGRIFR